MTFEEFWNNHSGDPYEIGLMKIAKIAWEAGADAKRDECVKLLYNIRTHLNSITGGHMNTQALQHQDKLEQQQMILEALKRLWWWDMSEDGDADALLIASALGLSKEFNKMLELEEKS